MAKSTTWRPLSRDRLVAHRPFTIGGLLERSL